MRRTRLTALTVVAFLALASGTAVGPATAGPSAPDPTYPTGSFQLERTSQWVTSNGFDAESAAIGITRLSLSDDATPSADIVVRLYSGSSVANSTNGAVLPASMSETTLHWGGATYEDDFPGYTLAGTYHPYATLTDGDGHTTKVDLPTVTLVTDRTGPVVKLKLPKKGHRKAIKSWRYISGTIVDAGMDNPASTSRPGTDARVVIYQKRKRYWYTYRCNIPDPRKQKDWCKRRTTLKESLKRHDPGISTKLTSKTGWRTPYIRGLTKGPLVVVVWGMDSNFNSQPVKVGPRYTLNRKK